MSQEVASLRRQLRIVQVVCVVLCLLLVGAIAASPQSKGEFEHLFVGNSIVVGGNGRASIGLMVDRTGANIALHDKAGKPRARLLFSEQNTSIATFELRGMDGKLRFEVTSSDSLDAGIGAGNLELKLYDANGTRGLTLFATQGGHGVA